MATTDNKVLTGAGVEQLSQLVKSAIAEGGGGSSLPTDPSTDGTYKLVNTVATVEGTQTATQSWEEDTGYTAGGGINIDSNKIKAYGSPTLFAPSAIRWCQRGLGTGMVQSCIATATSAEDFVNLLNLGYIVIANASYTVDLAKDVFGLHNGNYSVFTMNFSTGLIDIVHVGSYSQFTPNTRYLDNFYLKTSNNTLMNITNWSNGGYGIFPKLIFNYSTNFSTYTVGANLDELATTRVPSALVSTETAPTVEGAINWVYK